MPVTFTDPALDDLRRLGAPAGAPRARRLATLQDDADGSGELVPSHRLPQARARGGTWRVVYTVDDDVVTVWEVWVDGVRSAGVAYAEALHRM